MVRSHPDFSYEKVLWDSGSVAVGGADEVGRGAFAGPVTAACVVFKENQKIDVFIHDSKKLTQKERNKANTWIKENCISWGIGSVSAYEIDKIGIVKAANKAFRKAIKNTGIKLDYLLIDAFFIPRTKDIRKSIQKPIIKGDAKSISIAAASIIAKVHRDAMMTKLSKNRKYKKYLWDRNKGYGTKAHREAIKINGKSRLHRASFLLKLS